MVRKNIVKKIIKNTKNLYYNEIKRFDNKYYKPTKREKFNRDKSIVDLYGNLVYSSKNHSLKEKT